MLVRRPAGYAFRRVIPTYLRELMRRRELWVTLDTNDKSLAKSRACAPSLATGRLYSGVHRLTKELFQDINDSLRESVDDPEALVMGGVDIDPCAST
ncbi:DUF6538 domain-containing protein [Asaia bogorensis]|uniref:DUF6538 domain-containing protein n=1 Tax=Asaia bogorensis NBRC 16594 TaxID=1231624 RepID=A0AAN4R390_9PROT|nr:DUF6538 domain-containing protein [Asaia bogorensis]BAT20591.1 hypothetical protein Asbog_02336 [Asaia bogorensis NBRC 16594]GBQ76592.1 hypothetical protein AA0311_1198 [Asaia bogorensis NBRC 16594]GEL53602.1 hypothetical protein ABO01nite_16090 [Asaia bogorensis NBRC 16594]